MRGIRITEQRGTVAAAFLVGDDDDLFVIASSGIIIRMPSLTSRSRVEMPPACGIMNLEAGPVYRGCGTRHGGRTEEAAPTDPTES